MELVVSVIIPCYNSENTLPETIESILGQCLNNAEILIINDGSTDNSLEIAEKFANENENIRVISKENGGVSSARNEGVKQAKGKYIIFLDADDILCEGSLNAIIERIEETDADMLVWSLSRFGFGGKEENPIAKDLSNAEVIDIFDRRLLWNFLIGNKCFKAESLRESGVIFPPTTYCEDGAFIFSYLMKASPKISGVKDAMTLYRRADPKKNRSVTQSISEKKIKDYFTSCDIIENAIKNRATEDYLNEFYFKVASTIINEFYRQLWQIEQNCIDILKEKFDYYYEKLYENEKIKLLKSDIGIPLFSRQEVANSPLISVVSRKPSSEFLFSLFAQNMPCFELICENPLEYAGFENINEGKAKSNKKLRFIGKKELDTRLLRVILLLDKKFKILPLFAVKYLAVLSIKVKDMLNK